MASCANLPSSSQNWGRVTIYHKGEDKWGNRIASSKHRRAIEGRTIAASSKFPFGTILHFPLMKKIFGHDDFVVEDRGTAIEHKWASYGRTECFDFYVKNKRRMNQILRTISDYQPFHL
jgi:hypothetical protein